MKSFRYLIPAIDTPRLTIYDVYELVSSGETDFSRTNLMGLNLDCQQFNKVDFTKACLIGTTLSGSKITETNFNQANMQNVNLVDANLVDVNFAHAYMEGASLRGAKLQGCDFDGTNLRNANLAFANLKGAKNINFHFNSNGDWRVGILLTTTPTKITS